MKAIFGILTISMGLSTAATHARTAPEYAPTADVKSASETLISVGYAVLCVQRETFWGSVGSDLNTHLRYLAGVHRGLEVRQVEASEVLGLCVRLRLRDEVGATVTR